MSERFWRYINTLPFFYFLSMSPKRPVVLCSRRNYRQAKEESTELFLCNQFQHLSYSANQCRKATHWSWRWCAMLKYGRFLLEQLMMMTVLTAARSTMSPYSCCSCIGPVVIDVLRPAVRLTMHPRLHHRERFTAVVRCTHDFTDFVAINERARRIADD